MRMRPTPFTHERIPTVATVEKTSKEQVVLFRRVTQSKPLVLGEALLYGSKELAVDDRRTWHNDPLAGRSSTCRSQSFSPIHSRSRQRFRLNSHDPIEAELADIRAIAEHFLNRRTAPTYAAPWCVYTAPKEPGRDS
jgi:hypothetical protein